MTVLEPETTVEQELGRREEHFYQLELAKDARCGAGRLVNVHRTAGLALPTSTTVSCHLCAPNSARPECAP